MINEPKPNLTSLLLLALGSAILAIPGAYGGFFLVVTPFEGFSSIFDTFYLIGAAIPLMGYFLLVGYFVVLFSKKFNAKFWMVSTIYNLLGFLGSFLFLFFLSEPLIGMLMFWCIFATISSFYYYSFSAKQNSFSLN